MTRSDYDFDELVDDYGYEYLSEYNPDDCAYPMDEFDELTNFTPFDAIQRAFFGYDYNPYREGHGGEREPFNPNRDYFAFNGYANLVSIDRHDYREWMKRSIDEEEFVDWCFEHGYLDEDDDEE